MRAALCFGKVPSQNIFNRRRSSLNLFKNQCLFQDIKMFFLLWNLHYLSSIRICRNKSGGVLDLDVKEMHFVEYNYKRNRQSILATSLLYLQCKGVYSLQYTTFDIILYIKLVMPPYVAVSV